MNKMGVVKTIKMVQKIENRHSWFIYTPTKIQAKNQQYSCFINFLFKKTESERLIKAEDSKLKKMQKSKKESEGLKLKTRKKTKIMILLLLVMHAIFF